MSLEIPDLSKFPESTQLAALHEVLRERFRNSLFETCKVLLGYKDTTRHTHGRMIDALEASTTRKLLVMPRGTFKSSIGSVGYPIWRLIRNPNDRILLDGEVYSNSKNFLREIKAHIESPLFRSLFGEWKSESNWNEGEITVKPRTKPLKEASITCGGIETVKVGQHFSCIIGDDMNSGNNSGTPEACQKVVRHYQLNQAILEPDGTYVVIGTRYSQSDLIGTILRNEVGGSGNRN